MRYFSFSKDVRILKQKEFVNLNRSGQRRHTKHFIVILKQNGLGTTRLGVSVTKKTGNAVKRNRVKRLLREFFRLNKPYFPQGYDLLIAAKKDASYLDLQSIKEELAKTVFDKEFGI